MLSSEAQKDKQGHCKNLTMKKMTFAQIKKKL